MTDIGYLLARSDAEIGKIGPSPKGCGLNRATTSLSSLLWIDHSCLLRLVWPDFPSQRRSPDERQQTLDSSAATRAEVRLAN